MLAKCICTNCAGHLEFEEENAGESIQCPHCGFKTILFLPGEKMPSSEVVDAGPPARGFILKLICAGGAALVVVALGLALYRWVVPWLQDFEPQIDSNLKAIIVLLMALILTPLFLLWLVFPALLLLQLRKLTDALRATHRAEPLEADASELEQEGEPEDAEAESPEN